MKNKVLFTVSRLLVLVIVATLAIRAAANEVVNNSLQLQTLTITPASGSLVISPTWVFARAGALSGLGENVGGPCPQSITWMSADCSIDPVSLTGFVSANVNAPDGQWVYGSSFSYMYGTFEIVGTSGPVLVQFHAVIPYVQSLTTGLGYESSRIDVGVSFGGHIVVHNQLNYAIGLNSSINDSGIWNVSDSAMFNAGQQYTFGVLMRDDVAANPEPATVLLFLGGLSPIILSRWHAMRLH